MLDNPGKLVCRPPSPPTYLLADVFFMAAVIRIGFIPPEFGGMKKLQVCWLENNHIQGKPESVS